MYGSKPEPAGIVSVDREGVKTYHRAPMSVALPERLDASRMVQARRSFEGKLPIASFQRLRGSLAAVENGAKVEGEARYERVDQVFAEIRRSGVTRLGFVGNEGFAAALDRAPGRP